VSEGQNALTRWSQRKLAARHAGDAPTARSDADAPIRPGEATQESALGRPMPADDSPGREPGSGETPAAGHGVPDLPSIDQLDGQSDYTAFLAKNVPEALTRAALRKLWVSDPVLANLDGLNDYDEDYNLVDQAITAAQTSYRPGMGYLDEIEKELAQLEEPGAHGASDERIESQGRGEVSEGQAPGRGLGNSDARKDSSPDAPQPVTDNEAALPEPEPSEDAG
jgi:hypothetical protein